MSIIQKITQLEQKIKELAVRHAALLDENTLLKKKIETLEGEKKILGQNTSLSNQNQHIQNPELQKKLEYYIKEIDKCIEWIQQQ